MATHDRSRRRTCGPLAFPLIAALITASAGCTEDDAPVSSDAASASAAASSDGGAPDSGVAPSNTQAATTESLLLTVEEGKLEGKLDRNVRAFLGIPYGKPTTGARRFAAPEPADPWTGTKEAKAFGPSCPQPMRALSASGAQSEDCLSLNVYAPSGAPPKLPVMVFIPGGAFVSGGSSQYDGVNLAATGPVVVVTINYRLGALGLLSHPVLDAVRGSEPSGNDALRDQQLALNWVQKNIASFGGDPTNVTLFGESAGSTSTAFHLVSPRAKGLAKRFIMESGAGIGGGLLNDKTKANALGSELADALCKGDADLLACLRSKTAEELVAWGADRGITGAGWGATTNANDPVLPDTPAKLLSAGRFNQGALIVGSNKNEWELFIATGSPPVMIATVADLHTQIDRQFPAPDLRSAIKAHYTADDATARAVFVRLMTDAVFRCPSRMLARLTSSQGSTAYLYSFEEGMAWHAFELPYVFGNPSAALATATLVEPLRADLQGYWTQFAKTGDPNGAGGASWPAFETAKDQHMILKMSSEVGSALSKADCDFWEGITARSL